MKSDNGQMDLLFVEDLDIRPKYVTREPMPLETKLQFEKEVLILHFQTPRVHLQTTIQTSRCSFA